MLYTFNIENEPLKILQNACVTFGVFDGMHQGHKFEIESAVEDATLHNTNSVVVTFDIDPDEVFVCNFLKLMSNQERIDCLEKSGVDDVVVIDFMSIKGLDAIKFLDIFFKKYIPACLHVGNGFKFGNCQSGDTNLLIQWGKDHGMNVCVHDLIKKDGEVISSTKLRESKCH